MSIIGDSFNWILSFHNLERDGVYDDRVYRLDRMKKLSAFFGNPHSLFQSIHIAGSKGKGSTALYLAAILREAGVNVGVYTSPHLKDYRERISDGENFFKRSFYIEAIDLIKDKINTILKDEIFKENPPTVFELLTLTAFLVFKKAKCEVVIFETGLGGKLDATNIITPILSIITPIELEHTNILGKTIEEIAFQKAGIIKPLVPVISANQIDSVRNILIEVSSERNSPITFLDEEIKKITSTSSLEGTEFTLYQNNYPDFQGKIKQLSEIQTQNVALAFISSFFIKNLIEIPLITENLISKAISNVNIPARFQLIENNPAVIIDSAHTPNSFLNSVKSFNKIFKGCKVLIFSASKDKDVSKMAKIGAKYFKKIIITEIKDFKVSDTDRDFKEFSAVNKNCEIIEDNNKALLEAKRVLSEKKNKGAILISGSFYLASKFIN